MRRTNLIPWMAIPVGLLLCLGFAYSDKYPEKWDKKNKDAYAKVEQEKKEGKKSKPNDKTRHSIYKKKLEKQERKKTHRD